MTLKSLYQYCKDETALFNTSAFVNFTNDGYVSILLFPNNIIDWFKFEENNAGKGCNTKIKSG